ncbi:excisionase family DNA-binding protein [Treponema denticola]|uniref:excisionase family DNA-binding protein n=1 Tax=Treponema denticola TaxID=158 RepID=UPI0020A42DF5|nr:excisionase family DNA-binding protein [Treponema denticola]UTC92503.1 excisionase family DNA-binding protein [Treponema denticola]
MITLGGVDYYSVQEAAELLNVSYDYLLKKKGQIGYIQEKPGSSVWLASTALEAFLKKFEVVPKTMYTLQEK